MTNIFNNFLKSNDCIELGKFKIQMQTLRTAFFTCVLIFLMMQMSAVYAVSTSISDDMPWSNGLQTLVNSFTGPVPTVIALLGIVGSGAMLAFGAEISGIVKSVLIIVLVVCILINATKLLSIANGSSILLPAGL